MKTTPRTVRNGLVTLALAAALTAAAGPASADIPLETPASSALADVGLATGSAQPENGTGGTGGSGSASGSAGGSASGSGHALDPFARSILNSLDYVPCQRLDSTHVNTPLAGTAALILSLITGEWYVSPGCAS